MERLVLLVIAVIGLHTAFVLYMADIRRVDPNAATARRGPAGKAPQRVAVKPSVDTELQASVTALAAENPPATAITRETDRVTSPPPRVNSIARSEVTERKRPRPYDAAKPVPAHALRASAKTRGFKKVFGDTVVIYTTDISRPARAVTVASRSANGDNYHPKPKKNSFVAKLQLVYKKPWDLIKAVGSKLR